MPSHGLFGVFFACVPLVNFDIGSRCHLKDNDKKNSKKNKAGKKRANEKYILNK